MMKSTTQLYVERLEKEAMDNEGLIQDETHLLEKPTSVKRSKLAVKKKKFFFKKDQLQKTGIGAMYNQAMDSSTAYHSRVGNFNVECIHCGAVHFVILLSLNY
uniref:Uncharacterized protein n=1 Tax=Acrobeloides nanus TaxID=290746 RepID=A0A914CRA6_9BILA